MPMNDGVFFGQGLGGFQVVSNLDTTLFLLVCAEHLGGFSRVDILSTLLMLVCAGPTLSLLRPGIPPPAKPAELIRHLAMFFG